MPIITAKRLFGVSLCALAAFTYLSGSSVASSSTSAADAPQAEDVGFDQSGRIYDARGGIRNPESEAISERPSHVAGEVVFALASGEQSAAGGMQAAEPALDSVYARRTASRE